MLLKTKLTIKIEFLNLKWNHTTSKYHKKNKLIKIELDGSWRLASCTRTEEMERIQQWETEARDRVEGQGHKENSYGTSQEEC